MSRTNPIVSWYIPLDGDGHYAGTFEPEFAPTVDHMVAVAKAAESLGFDMALIPTFLLNSAFTEAAPRAEAITVATAIALATTKLELLLAFKLGEIHPALLAKICASLDHMSAGRLSLNITSGAGAVESRFGETLEHDDRYRRSWEAVTILNRLWSEDEVNFDGEFYQLKQAVSEPKTLTKPRPAFYTVGLSEIAKDKAAAEGDVHLIAPNVWNGMHNIKSGAGSVLVGSASQLTERCFEYYEAGVDVFILSSYPHIDEARIAGELLLPGLKERLM